MTIEKSGLSSKGRAHPRIGRSAVFKHGGDHGPLIGSGCWSHTGGRVANKKGQGAPAFPHLQAQPLGSIPLCWSSLRIMRLIQAAKDSSPSCCCASSMRVRSSGSSLNWKGGLPRRSLLCVDTSITPNVMCLCVMTHYTRMKIKAKPRGALTPTGPLTTTDKRTIEAAMTNRTTPHQGRAPLTLQKITWRFLVLGDSTSSVFKVEAHTEQEARKSLPSCRMAVFAARIMPEVRQ